MKILFVSTSIPPATDMQTTRNIYLIKSLLKKGNEVDILTCKAEGTIDTEFFEVLSKTNVFTTPKPSLLKLHEHINTAKIPRLIKKVYNVFINYFAIPDLYKGWDTVATEFIKKNKMFDYDVILTSSGSYTAHAIGNKWKKITQKKWIAEYGDPWGLDKYGKRRIINMAIENKMISNVDGIVFTTQPTIDAYEKEYKHKSEYCLVPCGFSSIIEDKKVNSKDNNRISFIYTGIAYKRDRDLTSIIRVVGSKGKEIDFTLIGTLSGAFISESRKFDNVKCNGRVPYNESLDMISKSDILVHIGNFGTLQVPGKTYIYLASKKPILYIKQEKKCDPTEQVLKDFPGVVIAENNEKDIERAVSYIISNYSDIKQKSEMRCESEKLKKYDWENLGSFFSDFVLHQVAK